MSDDNDAKIRLGIEVTGAQELDKIAKKYENLGKSFSKAAGVDDFAALEKKLNSISRVRKKLMDSNKDDVAKFQRMFKDGLGKAVLDNFKKINKEAEIYNAKVRQGIRLKKDEHTAAARALGQIKSMTLALSSVQDEAGKNLERSKQRQIALTEELGRVDRRNTINERSDSARARRQNDAAARKQLNSKLAGFRYVDRVRANSARIEQSAFKRDVGAFNSLEKIKLKGIAALNAAEERGRERAQTNQFKRLKRGTAELKNIWRNQERQHASIRREFRMATSSVGHAVRGLDHPFFSSPTFVAGLATAAVAHETHRAIQSAEGLDKAETLLRIRSMGLSNDPAALGRYGRKMRNEEVERGLRLGVDPAELMNIRSELIKQGIPHDEKDPTKDLASSITENMVKAAGAMHAPFEEVSREMGKVLAEGVQSGHLHNSEDVKRFLNVTTGVVNNMAVQPHEMMQFFDNAGMGAGKALGIEDWQTQFLAGALISKGARNGRTAANILNTFASGASNWGTKLQAMNESGGSTPEDRIFRNVPRELGMGSWSEMFSVLKTGGTEGILGLIQKIGGIGDRDKRNNVLRALGLEQHADVFTTFAADKGGVAEKYKLVKQLQEERTDQMTIDKAYNEWMKGLTFFVDRMKVAYTVLQATIGDALKESVGDISGEIETLATRIFKQETLRHIVDAVLNGFVQGFGFNNLKEMLTATLGGIDGSVSANGLVSITAAIKGFFEGFKAIAGPALGVLRALGGGGSEGIGKIVGGIFAFAMAMHMLRPIFGVAAIVFSLGKALFNLGFAVRHLLQLMKFAQEFQTGMTLGKMAMGAGTFSWGILFAGISALILAGLNQGTVSSFVYQTTVKFVEWLWTTIKDAVVDSITGWITKFKNDLANDARDAKRVFGKNHPNGFGLGTAPEPKTGAEKFGETIGGSIADEFKKRGVTVQPQSYDGNGQSLIHRTSLERLTDSVDNLSHSLKKSGLIHLASLPVGGGLAGVGGGEFGGGDGGGSAVKPGQYGISRFTSSKPGQHLGRQGGGSGAGNPELDGKTISPFKGSHAFNSLAPRIMGDLRKDFGLSKEDAAAVLGNLGHESGGFRFMQEKNPRGGGRGGLGWAQWTGPRRRAFEAWSAEHNLDPRSYEANYGFLRHELGGKYAHAIKRLKTTTGLQAKTVQFEKDFEGAGVKAYGSRFGFANKAMGLPDNVAQADKPAGAAASLPIPKTWQPKSASDIVGGVPQKASFGLGGAAGGSAGGGGHQIHAPITIHGAGHDPETIANMVQHRITEAMNYRMHDVDHAMS